MKAEVFGGGRLLRGAPGYAFIRHSRCLAFAKRLIEGLRYRGSQEAQHGIGSSLDLYARGHAGLDLDAFTAAQAVFRTRQVLTARLHELSTYGLLKDMAQDELQLYIDALVAARCLRVKGGAYPTISTTEFGDRVMREQEQVMLALPLRRAMAN